MNKRASIPYVAFAQGMGRRRGHGDEFPPNFKGTKKLGTKRSTIIYLIFIYSLYLIELLSVSRIV